MADFTDIEIKVAKLKWSGKRHNQVAAELGITDKELMKIVKSTVSKIKTTSDSIDFLTKIGQLSGEKICISRVETVNSKSHNDGSE